MEDKTDKKKTHRIGKREEVAKVWRLVSEESEDRAQPPDAATNGKFDRTVGFASKAPVYATAAH